MVSFSLSSNDAPLKWQNWLWEALDMAQDDPAHPFRRFIFASLWDNQPRLRYVILRYLNASEKKLGFYTDRRSSKCNQISRNPSAEALFYDPDLAIQARMSVRATLAAPELNRKHWQQLSSIDDYAAAQAPGTAVPDPETALLKNDDQAERNFQVVELETQAIDLLYLSKKGHLRMRFTTRNPNGQWIVP